LTASSDGSFNYYRINIDIPGGTNCSVGPPPSLLTVSNITSSGATANISSFTGTNPPFSVDVRVIAATGLTSIALQTIQVANNSVTTVPVTGLDSGTTYRLAIVNRSDGTMYGSPVSFTTSGSAPVAPTITTLDYYSGSSSSVAGFSPSTFNYSITVYNPTIVMTANISGGTKTETCNGSAVNPLTGCVLAAGSGNTYTIVVSQGGLSNTYTITVTYSAGGGGGGSSSGLTPLFASASSNDGRFTAQVTNYDSAFTYAVTSTAGQASINSTGLVTVTGLGIDQSVSVTVTTTRTGYSSASGSVSGRSQVAAMTPSNKPTVTLSDTLITCTIGSYSATPTSAAFSLFVDGKHVSTIFSALGEYLPDWIIPWATSSTITRTASLTSATWAMSDAYKGKEITCSTLAYSKNAIGFTASQVMVAR
jgi:titin